MCFGIIVSKFVIEVISSLFSLKEIDLLRDTGHKIGR